MCKECGCGQNDGSVKIDGPSPGKDHKHEHHHDHGHDHHHEHHDHDHPHPHSHGTTTISLNRSLMEKNDNLAERNREIFRSHKLLVLNVVSSPGSGKTTFIRETAARLAGKLRLGVIVGDLATDNDAARLRSTGIPVVQITTGTVCHLDADMVAKAAERINLDDIDILIVENVGNLVCPADYDLGEDMRVVLLSTTEGEDKPLKYPPMFHSANVAIVTKSDMSAAAGFDRDQALANLKKISHHATIFELSSKTGEGMTAWLEFLEQKHHQRSHL